MALNFPANPEPGDAYSGDNGVIYTYDGIKWTGTGAEPGLTLPVASTTSAGVVRVDGNTITITNGVISAANEIGPGGINTIENGDSNVAIITPNGAITVNANNKVWSFGTDANLTLPTNGIVRYANGVSILSGLGGSYGNTQVAAYLPTYTGNITAGNLTITGNLDQPNRGFGNGPGTDLYITAGHTQGCSIPGGDTIISGGLGYGGVAHYGGNVTLRTGDYYSKQWNFDYDGTLTVPGGIEFTSSTAIIGNVDVITVLDSIRSPAYQFANGVNILDTITGVTSINTSVATSSISDASGDYTYGALSYDYAVNGVTSGGFTISYSAPLVYGNVDISVGNVIASNVSTGTVITPPATFANLVAVSGARAFVNDANIVAVGNFGSLISGGGSNTAPVWSDGVSWYIG